MGTEATGLRHSNEGVEDGFNSVLVGGVEVDVEGCVGDGVPVAVDSGDEGQEVVVFMLEVYTVALSAAGVCDRDGTAFVERSLQQCVVFRYVMLVYVLDIRVVVATVSCEALMMSCIGKPVARFGPNDMAQGNTYQTLNI